MKYSIYLIALVCPSAASKASNSWTSNIQVCKCLAHMIQNTSMFNLSHQWSLNSTKSHYSLVEAISVTSVINRYCVCGESLLFKVCLKVYGLYLL